MTAIRQTAAPGRVSPEEPLGPISIKRLTSWREMARGASYDSIRGVFEERLHMRGSCPGWQMCGDQSGPQTMAAQVVRYAVTIVAHLTCSRIRRPDANEADTKMVSGLCHYRATVCFALSGLAIGIK